MAITFVAASTTSNASQNTQTPAEPAGAQDGDFMLFKGGINDIGGTWTDPADFNELDQEDYGAGGNTGSAYLGWKIRTGGAGSGYQLSSSSAATQMSCAVLAFRGVDPLNPLDVTYSAASHLLEPSGSDLTAAAQPITTVSANAWVILVQRWLGAIAGITHGVPANYTSRSEILAANRSFQIATREIAVAGTETPGVWTTTGAGGTEQAIDFTLALRPLVVAAGGFRSRIAGGLVLGRGSGRIAA